MVAIAGSCPSADVRATGSIPQVPSLTGLPAVALNCCSDFFHIVLRQYFKIDGLFFPFSVTEKLNKIFPRTSSCLMDSQEMGMIHQALTAVVLAPGLRFRDRA